MSMGTGSYAVTGEPAALRKDYRLTLGTGRFGGEPAKPKRKTRRKMPSPEYDRIRRLVDAAYPQYGWTDVDGMLTWTGPDGTADVIRAITKLAWDQAKQTNPEAPEPYFNYSTVDYALGRGTK
jgi:hypothetical protein